MTFTSTLSKTDYDKYIEAGVQTRRNTYRGKDITKYWNGKETVNNRNLYDQISNCTFDDIYVGDYITGNGGTIWLIADLNNYRYSGNVGNGLEQCHATIIPAKPLTTSSMNAESTTKGGYYNSNMVQSILGTKIQTGATDVLNKYIVPDFNGHIIPYKNLLSNLINESGVNQYGIQSGVSSSWSWYDRYLDLMSEVNVYGSIIWSSSGNDIGIDDSQYAIFQLKPEFKNSYEGLRFGCWLKAVASSTSFVV